MAKSKFEYVKKFEQHHVCLPNTWMVARLDGRCFHRFAEQHGFEKPNDDRALGLMNKCAEAVFREFSDIVIAYGQSDEYSFVFRRDSNVFTRRESKIVSTLTSFFAASFVFHWSEFFPTVTLLYPPTFDGRIVLYPSRENLRDYLSWRQADCHINNLYNTCFWKLVHSGLTTADAEKRLYGTVSSDKNELLFTEFGTNYNDLPQMHRKGTVIIWGTAEGDQMQHDCTSTSAPSPATTPSGVDIAALMTAAPAAATAETGSRKGGSRKKLVQLHEDIIGDTFWCDHPRILGE